MQKLLSCLLVTALVISLALAGCSAVETGSPSTGEPNNESPSQPDGTTPSGGETEEPGTGDDGTEPDWEPAITGSLEIRVTDAPPEEEVTAILVTISSIEVHRAVAEQEQEQEGGSEQNQEQEAQSGDSWLTLAVNGTNPFDLIELRDAGVTALLAVEELEAGKYTQIRLIIDDVWVAVGEGTAEEAMLPSDELKLIKPFDIEEGVVTVLTVDFDAAESVHFTGQGNAIIHPVVKLTVAYEPEGA